MEADVPDLLRGIRAASVNFSKTTDPTKMATYEFGSDEIDEAFRLMETKEDGIIKSSVEFE